MYLQDFICTFAFATLASAAVAKQVPHPGWDKYAGERHGQHHESYHGHVHAREAEAEADPTQKAAWEQAHGGPAPTYKWTVPTGTHGFPTGWPTKVPQFQHGSHHARDAMPEAEAEAMQGARPLPKLPQGGYHQHPDWSEVYAHPQHYPAPHHARDVMPEAEAEAMAEPGFGHHTHDHHHAQHTGSWTEPAAWKSWLSAHPSATHGPHHARDAEADPVFWQEFDFPGNGHGAKSGSPTHPSGTQIVNGFEPSAWKSWFSAIPHTSFVNTNPSQTQVVDWAGPTAWKSWLSSHPMPTGSHHHAREAEPDAESEAMAGMKEKLDKVGNKLKQGFEKLGHNIEHEAHHFARDVPDFDGENVDTSLEGYGNLHARDAEPEADPWNMPFGGHPTGSFATGAFPHGSMPTGPFPHGAIPKHGNHWARDVPDFGGEDVDTSLAGYSDLHARDVPDFGDEDVDTSLDGYESIHARDVEDDEEPEEINYLARREADEGEPEEGEPEEINFLARREAMAEADPRNALQFGEGAHPVQAAQAAQTTEDDEWVTSDWHKKFLADHGVKLTMRDVEDAEDDADFAHDAGVYDDVLVAAEYTAPPAEDADIQ